ncbi:type I polyketide synthase [Streptacidiphilus jiangxiensis]|uniref:Acyl transferase domain-containing protein n=1 Tax=Streptacidiphilus jiangxiensis TaxID=235985 RepID=A0A1H7VM44_STRJI|nr:type I polyketide synthase [Streptacidiphilus jiangxiensis]SEM10331.1 Acyl transferase domain-containing protein [Streptacidiphilus jiangxiensis]
MVTSAQRVGSDQWEQPVAVVGMAGRFPGAPGVADLWAGLLAGRESLTRLTGEQLAAAGVPDEDRADPDYVPVRGILDGADLFDAELFGYSAREAELTDPQQRLLLECAWEALDDAGHGGYDGRAGVFAGTGANGYLLRHVLARPGGPDPAEILQVALGNEKDHAATRIAYKLGLRGPALTVQTACSTSLVAVHLACQSLLRGECDLALAGGASVQLPQEAGYLYSPHGILSPDGHCRPFDREAHGTVVGSGVGLVVLKRLDEALADGDRVHAVIRGSALNNDGSRKIGYTAPSAAGQTEVVTAALRAAGVDAAGIGYVEAHGTGTELGDGIEVSALTEAYRESTDATGYCALGSVKANVGHLDAAAGVTGLIKTVLAVREGVVPPSINCEQPNPQIDWENSPFFVNTEARPWPVTAGPRRAAVSAFGLGGTNVHVVVEQAPRPEPDAASEDGAGSRVVVVSAHSEQALRSATRSLADRVRATTDDAELTDVAHTLRVGRAVLPWRVAVAGTGAAELGDRLENAVLRKAARGVGLGYLFPGQGAQYPGMAAGLHRALPAFRQAFDDCCDLLDSQSGPDLRPLLLGSGAGAGAGDEAAAALLRDTGLAQPALFVTEYALGRQLAAWGLRPRMMLGHSVGEYAAAALAQAVALPDALRLVTARARLMAALPGGAMLAVLAAEETVAALLPAELSVAAVNGPQAVVVSGPEGAVAAFARELGERGIDARPLHVSHAFHSAMMDPVLDEFRRIAAQVTYRRPRTRVLSNLTGDVVKEYSADYWTAHLRQPVRFAAGLGRMLGGTAPVLLEVGPGQALTSLARSQDGDTDPCCVATMPRAGERRAAHETLLAAVGTAWTAGAEVDWRSFAPDGGRRVPLPAYPFQRRRFWLEPAAPPRAVAAAEPAAGSVTDPMTDPAADPVAAPAGNEGPPTVRTSLEAAWQRLLGTAPAAAETDFFDLGGDSLLSVRLIGLVRREHGVELSLQDVLENPTFGAQIAHVERLLAATTR